MKKILSFLTKKPLALAAVALFSVSSFAQGTNGEVTPDAPAGNDEATPKELLDELKVDIWERVSETNPLYYFDKVTVVDESYKKIYADDNNGTQLPALDFDPAFSALGSQIPTGASYFYVSEGAPTADAFGLNKELQKNDDGEYVNSKGEVVTPEEGTVPTKGAKGIGDYLWEDGSLKKSSVWTNVSWLWADVYTSVTNAKPGDRRFLAYNEGNGLFMVTDNTSSEFVPAVLYKATAKYKPYFDPEEGYYRATGEKNIVKIINPKENNGGKIEYATEKDKDGKLIWKDYPTGGVEVKTGVETTITARVVFDKGNTGEVTSTYLFYEIEDPTITPQPKEGDMVDENGEFNVTIATTEEGLKYTVGKGTEVTPDDETEVEVNIVEGLELPATVTVTAKSTKTITFKGKDVEVESDPATTATYIIGAYPAPQEVEFFAESETGVKPEGTVDLGEDIYVWFKVDQKGYGIEYDGTKDANKKLTLKFENGDQVVVDIVPAEDGRVAFTVPTDEAYANSYFTFDVPEGFYYTYTGEKKANQVPTDEQKNVKFYTGLLASHFILDVDLALDNQTAVTDKYLTTDDVFVDFQIYLNPNEQDVEVDFSEEALELQKTDPTMGVNFTEQKNGKVTPIEKVEKLEDTPNIFRVFFVNEEGKNKYVEDALKNENLIQKGYIMGFPAGTFISGDSKNKDDLSANIYFTEAVDLTAKVLRKKICEGVDGVLVFVNAKGKILNTDYSTPYYTDVENQIVNPDKTKIQIAEDVEVVMTGVDINNQPVKVKATLTPLPSSEKSAYAKHNSKDIFWLQWTPFAWDQDNGTDYTVAFPDGAFTVNECATKEFTTKFDVLGHPVWEVAARPFAFDKDGEAKELVLEGKATIYDEPSEPDGIEDDKAKTFEEDVKKYFETRKLSDGTEVQNISVDGTPVESWEVSEVSAEQVNEDGLKYETFVVTLKLAEPIKDVNKHTVKIGTAAFYANACNNKAMSVDVYPEVEYDIQHVTYCISTAVPSVTYYIWAKLPDGSYLNAPIKYVGETGKDKTELNAAALNNAENPTTEAAKYPGIETATEVGEFDGHPATLFTVKFTDITLKPWVAKMNFPVGTVQAEGYVANAVDLFNNIKIIPEIEFDATSSFADFLTPQKTDKKKVYNIPTSQKTIRLYLTGFNKYNNTSANKQVQLLTGSELLISEKAGVTLEWEPVDIPGGYIAYDVTFVDEKGEATGLQEGSYTLTVQEHTVMNMNYDPKCNPKIDCDNQEAFELTINVEDFAAPRHVQEITTKTWTFPVPNVKGLSKIAEDGPAITLDGKEVEAACDEEGVLTVTLPEVDGEYDFLPTGDYKLVIPAGAIEGKNTTNYNDLEVDVKVIYEFVDFGTGMEDGLGNDLTTTKEDVAEEVGYDQKMLFTRNFTNQNKQAFAVPFDVKQADVAKYFTIYKIDFVKADPENPDDPTSNTLNFVPVGEEGTAYANKPYIIIPTEEAVAEGLVSIKFKSLVQEPEVAEDIQCSTTMVKFDFFNTIEETAATEGWFNLTQNKIRLAGDVIPVWRWYIVPSDKGVQYIKIAINGFVDNADGIDFVEAAEGDNLIFNVAGQKLNTAAKGKVNIINGKKVLVK